MSGVLNTQTSPLVRRMLFESSSPLSDTRIEVFQTPPDKVKHLARRGFLASASTCPKPKQGHERSRTTPDWRRALGTHSVEWVSRTGGRASFNLGRPGTLARTRPQGALCTKCAISSPGLTLLNDTPAWMSPAWAGNCTSSASVLSEVALSRPETSTFPHSSLTCRLSR